MKIKSLIELTKVEGKIFMREPEVVFFAFIFPLLLLLTLGPAFGDIYIYIPSLMAMIITGFSLMGAPITLAEYRELKILKRLKATPLPLSVVLLSQMITNFIMFLISTFLIIFVGKIVFNIKIADKINMFGLLVVFVLSFASFYSLGFMISGLFKKVRGVSAASSIIAVPMLFLSGVFFPRENLPKILHKISDFIPLTYVNNSLTNLWMGNNLADETISIIILFVMLFVCTFVSIKTFRWE